MTDPMGADAMSEAMHGASDSTALDAEIVPSVTDARDLLAAVSRSTDGWA